MNFLKNLLDKIREQQPGKGINERLTAVIAIITIVLGAIAAIQEQWPKVVTVEKTVEVVKTVTVKEDIPEPPQLKLTAGWVNDPDEVEFVRVTNGIPNFGDTPAGKASLSGDGDVYLWDFAKLVTGSTLPDRNQGGVGSCVSFGTACAVEHLLLAQIVHTRMDGGPAKEFKPLCQEVIYGGSRVEIGGGRISGDGSVGAWAAQFIAQWGVVPRENIEGFDLTAYSESLCRKWGREGVPAKLEAVAKQSPVKGTALVKTATEAEKAIRQGYAIAVCSNQGFASTRDSQGFARPSGSWAHCMAIIGYRGGARPGFFIQNSWGSNWISGPRFPADAPAGGFWADTAVVDRMLRQGDSWAFSDAVGFPSRELDFFIKHKTEYIKAPIPKTRIDSKTKDQFDRIESFLTKPLSVDHFDVEDIETGERTLRMDQDLEFLSKDVGLSSAILEVARWRGVFFDLSLHRSRNFADLSYLERYYLLKQVNEDCRGVDGQVGPPPKTADGLKWLVVWNISQFTRPSLYSECVCFLAP